MNQLRKKHIGAHKFTQFNTERINFVFLDIFTCKFVGVFVSGAKPFSTQTELNSAAERRTNSSMI